MTKRIEILFFLVALSLPLLAQRHFQLPVWETPAAGSDEADANLHVYLANNPNGKAILVFPGGGYTTITTAGHDVAGQMNQNGISVIILKYRLPKGRSEVPLKDAEQAMRIIRSHAQEWGIASDQLGVMGNSAGGHLAATLSTLYSSKETRPDFQILLYPVITMDPAFTHMGTRKSLLGASPSADLEKRFSLEKQVTKDTPRAFIVLSAADDVVQAKNSLVYAQACIDYNVPVSLHVYPNGLHGFGYSLQFKDADIWHPELMRWLERDGQ